MKKRPVYVKIWIGMLVMGIVAGCHHAQTDPRPQALAYYTALSRQDWKAVYPLTAFSPEEKDVYKDAADFAQKMEKQLAVDGPDKQGFDYLKQLTDIAVGMPTISDDKADVPTYATLKHEGKTLRFHGMAHLIEQGGVWKFDTTASGPDVTAKAIAALLGQAEDRH